MEDIFVLLEEAINDLEHEVEEEDLLTEVA